MKERILCRVSAYSSKSTAASWLRVRSSLFIDGFRPLTDQRNDKHRLRGGRSIVRSADVNRVDNNEGRAAAPTFLPPLPSTHIPAKRSHTAGLEL